MPAPAKRLPTKRQPIRRGERVKRSTAAKADRVYAEASAAEAFARALLVAHACPPPTRRPSPNAS